MSKDFDCLSEHELKDLSSDELIAQIREATDAGRPDCAQQALAILCWRHFDNVQRRIAIKVPTGDVEDAAMTVIMAAIKSAFDGTSEGEFVNWLNRIVDRRGIADYHRSRENEPPMAPLAEEVGDEEETCGEQVTVEDETGKVLVEALTDQCLGELQDSHRLVVELNVFDGYGADETADRVNSEYPDRNPAMTATNVHKIVSRFRECLREKLADEEPDPG